MTTNGSMHRKSFSLAWRIVTINRGRAQKCGKIRFQACYVPSSLSKMGRRKSTRELASYIDNTCFELNMGILGSYGDFTEPIPSMVAAVRSILTMEGVLPNLEWLDICAPMNTDNDNYTRSAGAIVHSCMDATTLLVMPMCLPKLTKVCIVGCFPIFKEFSPFKFREFLRGWQSSLQQLTLGQVRSWMTSDHHVRVLAQPSKSEAILRRTLELLNCDQVDRYDGYHYDGYHYDINHLGDSSIDHIAEKCHSLESFILDYICCKLGTLDLCFVTTQAAYAKRTYLELTALIRRQSWASFVIYPTFVLLFVLISALGLTRTKFSAPFVKHRSNVSSTGSASLACIQLEQFTALSPSLR